MKLLKSIHTEKYDIIIDAYSKLESWFVVLFSGAKQKNIIGKRNFSIRKRLLEKASNSNLGLIIEQRLGLLTPCIWILKLFQNSCHKRRTLPLHF
jgi:heptosyltransferase-2